MTTLQQLIDRCEAQLADSGNATFSAADIEQWVRDAIQDYSQHFPRQSTETLNMSTGTCEYSLDITTQFVLYVEYPDGKDPRQYLRRRNVLQPNFWTVEGNYHVEYPNDPAAAPTLTVSSQVATGEDAIVTYLHPHEDPATTATTITVPVQHEHLLVHYVLWRAVLQLKAAEEAAPTSNSSLLMSQLAINVDRARRAYVDALAKAVYTVSHGGPVSWAGQDQAASRIY